MYTYKTILVIIAVFLSLQHVKAVVSAVAPDSLTIPVYNFEELEPLLHQQNDTVYVVNFWATWCRPCVAELPYFVELQNKYAARKLKILLVSLDFKKQIKKKLIPFIHKNKLDLEVVVLSDPDANSWIDKVSPEWSGAIPATLIYHKENRILAEDEFENFEALESLILELDAFQN